MPYVLLLLLACMPLSSSATVAPQALPYLWRNVEIGAGGFVPGINFHPTQKGLLYCRTDIGGAYRMDVKSGRWQPITDLFRHDEWNLLGIDAVGLDPKDGDKLYLACGAYLRPWASNAGILISGDRGATWKHWVELPFKMGGNQDGRSMGERLVVDPADSKRLLLGTRQDGLWESRDSGLHWAQVDGFPYEGATPNDGGIGFVTFVPKSNQVYAGVSDKDKGLYLSRDAGKTWSLVEGRPAGLMPHHGTLAADGRTLYLSFADGPGPNGMGKGAVWKLDTKAGAWTDITPEPGATYGYAGLALDPKDPKVVMVASMDRWIPGDEIWRSTDGGASWKAFGPTAQRDLSATPYLYWGRPRDQKPGSGNWVGSLVMDPFNPDRLLYGTGATIMECLDVRDLDKGLATNWHVKGMGVEETAVLDLASLPEGPHLISGIGDIGGFTHDDLDASPAGGMTIPVYTTVTSLDFAQGRPAVLARVAHASHSPRVEDRPCGGWSLDFGKSWKNFPSRPKSGKEGGKIALSFDAASIVWTPEEGQAHLSTDFGRSWSRCKGLPEGAEVVADRAVAGRFYSLQAGTLYASEDGGRSFRPRAKGLELGKKARLHAAPGREGDLWLAGGDEGLFRSRDGGRTFSRLPGCQAADTVGFGKPAPGKDYHAVFLCGQVRSMKGIFRSDDEGMSFSGLQAANQQWGWVGRRVIGDPRIQGRVYVATNGRGIQVGEPAAGGPR